MVFWIFMQRVKTNGAIDEDKQDLVAANGSVVRGTLVTEKTSDPPCSSLVFGYLNLFSDGVVSIFFWYQITGQYITQSWFWSFTIHITEVSVFNIQMHFVWILQHNFTDGMALGSAFLLHGSVGGWSRTLFLLAHEIPQEVSSQHNFFMHDCKSLSSIWSEKQWFLS